MTAVAETREVMAWEREAIDLKKQGLESKDIAVAVDKSAATVRKAIAKARERGDLPEDPLAAIDTNAPPVEVSDEPYVIPGQTTVDDFTITCEHGTPNADVCGECDSGVRDPLDDFRAEAGDAVGDMPPLTPPEPGEPEVVAPVMPGTRQLVLDFGPNAAPVFSASVKFSSEKWPSGHFGMGDLVTGTFTARVVGIPAKEKFDRDIGEYVAAPLTYSALITEIDYEPVEEHD